MLFQRFQSGGLYLAAGDIANPSTARAAFLFQDASRTDASFDVTSTSWGVGLYVFFAPSSTRDWASFAAAVRAIFVPSSGIQFAFVSEAAGNVSAVSTFIISGQAGSYTLAAPANFQARNVTVNVSANPIYPPVVAFDDQANQFTISNFAASNAAVVLTFIPATTSPVTLQSLGQNLLLPLAGSLTGCIGQNYAMTETNLTSMEAGPLYFAPPANQGAPLTALRYPMIRSLKGASAAMSFSFWFDVLAPTYVERTYFQVTDTQLGSYFASANGVTFTLRTNASGAAASISRFVLSNRPVQQVTDANFFYLAPAGTFGLSAGSQVGAAASVGKPLNLLCGISGTEFMQVGADGTTMDVLQFVPNQPGYAGATAGSTTQLDPSTQASWVQYGTATGVYVSQPEQSPLYQQSSNAQISLGSQTTSIAYLLEFLPLPSWAPGTNGGTVALTPAVPMVPYAGIPASVNLAPFRTMETIALNPTRRNLMMASAQKSLEAQLAAKLSGKLALSATAETAPVVATWGMTPQGLLAGLTDDVPPIWTSVRIALSPAPANFLQMDDLGAVMQTSLKQNRIFLVNSTTGPSTNPLYGFTTAQEQQVNISDWIFNLSPGDSSTYTGGDGDDSTQPLILFKFYDGKSISDLVDDITLWSSPDELNTPNFTSANAQSYLQLKISEAKTSVEADPNSLYANFYAMVTDPNFAGILAMNCGLQLNDLPPAIQAVLGGMTRQQDGKTVSNVDQFRAHHLAIQINDTDPGSSTPQISQSSFSALVDYEKPTASGSAVAVSSDLVPLGFEVEYLRALFTNSELRTFSCQLNLTINNLFDTSVSLDAGADGSVAADSNVVEIMGSYQNHSSGTTEGEGVYSFVAQGNFVFTFGTNDYLDTITLTKLQFSFAQSTNDSNGASNGATVTNIASAFAIWGALKFKPTPVLDLFSFDSLSFADLGINVSFDLTLDPPQLPSTSNLTLTFSPGNLRLDLAQTEPRGGDRSLLSLLPFRLKSFLYSQKADQTLESLNYFSLGSVPGLSSVADTFNYALAFDLDLGSAGALVGSLEAFKFGFILGWLSGPGGGVAFGVQMPSADGKLEIKIQGVFDLIIGEFVLQYVTSGGNKMLVIGLLKSSVEILGQRIPPSGELDFALFKTIGGEEQVGWMVAWNNTGGGGDASRALRGSSRTLEGETGKVAHRRLAADNGTFNVKYVGLGQRVGPDPTSPPTTFAGFLEFMTKDFYEDFEKPDYNALYHPDAKWLVVVDIELLKVLEFGFIFYDVTPFYSLMLNVPSLFEFEITYTKVSDTIGLYYANLTLPESLRTFQCGAASVMLPSLAVSVYTNGNWKVNLGFPNGDDWSGCFQVQAMAGPVPVTGAGGFYVASLSSATDKIFVNNYPSILAFGLAVRLGVGKDFTAGPLSAGVSITFFGIIEGAVGYLSSGSTEIFRTPDALMLSGQFGLIGQIYGSIDFKIISASVNVTLSASIGVVLKLEQGVGGDILLYVQASVSLSVSLSINLGFFSISISFSFNATFRFQWTLLSSGSQHVAATLAFVSRTLATTGAPAVLPLCPGFAPAMPLWFLPELTVVFPDSTNQGLPYFVMSLAVQFDPAPPASPQYSDFKPFEALTTQLTTWALMNAFQLPAYDSTIEQAQLSAIDQTPDELVGFLTYELLLQQLAVFAQTTITVPSSSAPTNVSAATFPMPPFLEVATVGRLNGSNQPNELIYTFDGQNVVSSSYLQEVQEYFNQLFLNSLQSETPDAPTALLDTTVPFAQQVFLEYFTGLIRSGVHALLQTMENAKQDAAPLDQVFCAAVGSTSFAALGGQMSSMFRGGARLPYTAGLTIPDATVNQSTNPLYSLLWQQFPVGTINSTSNQYLVNLTQPDTTQTWITANVSYALTSTQVTPYTGLTASSIAMPGAPTLIPFTSTGPQSFSFANPTTWTQIDNTAKTTTTANLYAFPSSLLTVTGVQSGATNMLVASRSAGQAYLDDVVELPGTSYAFATTVEITAKQIPAGSGGKFLPNVYGISGASQSEQALLAAILAIPEGSSPVASIQVLYQTAAGASGLTSTTPADVFVLRTNTTTVSAPPPQAAMAMLAAVPAPTVAVGATTEQVTGFLQILEEAAVTNAPGYYLYYKTGQGNDLPGDLFTAGPAPLTILITFTASNNTPVAVEPYYNTLEIFQPDASLVYFAETVDPALDLQYAAVAPGAVGAELVRTLAATMLTAPDGSKQTRLDFLAATAKAGVGDEQALHQALAAAGSAPAQLNSLYSLVTYQVQATAGAFVESNLSAPLQPQAPPDAKDTDPRSYRAFVPLYALATANQSLPAGTPQNRYASIGGSYTVEFFLNDCFGNQMPGELPFTGTNLYFDTILALDTWTGVVPSFNFAYAKANTVDVTLTPGAAAFSGMSLDQAKSSLSQYQTIGTQINGPGVSFYVASSLSLDANGSPASVTLNAPATAAVQQMVTGIEAYLTALVAYLTTLLESPNTPPSDKPPFTVQAVEFAVVLPATVSALPAAFGLSVSFGIERDVALLAPSLIGPNGVILFPSAQHVSTNVAPDATAQTAMPTFAANFVASFPALSLAVGLGGAQDTPKTKSAQQRKALRSLGVAADPAVSTGASATPALWAAATSLTQVTIANANNQPLYLAPKPLLNSLESGTVPMPTLPGQQQLPPTQSFVDVDLDVVNASFFAAVDQVLTPATAAAIFDINQAAYTALALGREGLATGYSHNELDWLFTGSTFTGTSDDLTEAISFFDQGCRASLMTAYTVDTLLQFGVAWYNALPAGAEGNLSLYGRVQPVPASGQKVDPSQNTAFSCSQIEVPDSGNGLLTVGYSSPDITDEAQVTLPLQFTLTHLQVFTEPASEVPANQARPSLWLQLVNPVTILFGDQVNGTVIPLVYRQYPTPPTLIAQTGAAPTSNVGAGNPLTQAAQWVYSLRYQAQLTAHDQLGAYITWNTVVASNAERLQQQALLGETTLYTLFQALCRFNAAYPILQQMLVPGGPNLSDAATTFAQLVTDVVNNTDWNPVPQPSALAATAQDVSDPYVIDDQVLSGNSRQITLTWTGQQSSMPGGTLAIVGVAPDGTVYPGQQSSSITNGIQDDYTANPPIVDDWVSHLLTVQGIDVLTAENARAGIQVERNLITLDGENVKTEYVYMTPYVEAPQPVTPFLDNDAPINMTTLPSVTPGTACSGTNPANLCQRVNTLLMNLLTISSPGGSASYHRLKLACSFAYPLTSAAGMPAAANPLTPLIPVVFARSFDIQDSEMAGQVGAFSAQYAAAIEEWTAGNAITFGSGSAPAGGQLIFDVTLFAQLSGNSRPLLRLRNLQLALTDIEAGG
jgi:hypothetical protein